MTKQNYVEGILELLKDRLGASFKKITDESLRITQLKMNAEVTLVELKLEFSKMKSFRKNKGKSELNKLITKSYGNACTLAKKKLWTHWRYELSSRGITSWEEINEDSLKNLAKKNKGYGTYVNMYGQFIETELKKLNAKFIIQTEVMENNFFYPDEYCVTIQSYLDSTDNFPYSYFYEDTFNVKKDIDLDEALQTTWEKLALANKYSKK